MPLTCAISASTVRAVQGFRFLKWWSGLQRSGRCFLVLQNTISFKNETTPQVCTLEANISINWDFSWRELNAVVIFPYHLCKTRFPHSNSISLLALTYVAISACVAWPAFALESFAVDVTDLLACSAVKAVLDEAAAIVAIATFETFL